MAVKASERNTNGLIAAERRRKIYAMTLESGSVNVSDLCREFRVQPNTIRNDLQVLQTEGKVIRAHGGAVVKELEVPRLPYGQMAKTHLQEKAWIGQAALAHLPTNGSIFLSSGSTVFELAKRLPANWPGHIVTNSPYVAIQVSTNTTAHVDLLGGSVVEGVFCDCSLSEEALRTFYWDVTFSGAAAIDMNRGITAINRSAAVLDRIVFGRGSKVVVLCDSSKFGRLSYVESGPVSVIDVLVTDTGIDRVILEELRSQGIEVALAGPSGIETADRAGKDSGGEESS